MKIINAQIVLPNKEMEDFPCLSSIGGNYDTFVYIKTCSIHGYFQCDSFIGILDKFSSNPPVFYPAFPYSGQTCLGLSDYSNTLKGTVSTILNCPLRKDRKYKLTYWAADYFNLETVFNQKTLQVWGNTDTCNRIEKIYESGQIDTGWHQYTAILTTKLQDYEFIHFRIGLTDSITRILLLDALSDIYPFNANDITATIKDTTFTKPNTSCIELSATANITTYDTVYWQDAAGNKIADGFNGGTVCPDTSTHYIIAMRDSVPDCAGVWWSYDTVKVTVNTGTAVAPLSSGEGLGVRLYPNPATNSITIQTAAHSMQQISIYDINGKMLFTQQANQTTQTQIALEGIVQTPSVYIAEIKLANGLKQRAKFLKQ